MKRNSGSAITSVVVVFLLVTMISVPLLSNVVYNYQLREYDSGIKEAEYRNEIIMDKVATIIKNEVIAAISEAKQEASIDIDTINTALDSAYSIAYSEAVEEIAEYKIDENEQPTTDITNKEAVLDKIKEKLPAIILSQLSVNNTTELKNLYGINDVQQIVNILDLPIDEKDSSGNSGADGKDDLTGEPVDYSNIASPAPKDEYLQDVCNVIFQKKYQNLLLGNYSGRKSVFWAIYNGIEGDTSLSQYEKEFGTDKITKEDTVTHKTLAEYFRLVSKYNRAGNGFSEIYTKEEEGSLSGIFLDDTLEIGIECNYKLSKRVPLTTLSATFVINTPNFNTISQIEQYTVPLSTPVLDYSLIAGDTLTLNGKSYIDGNILARANGIKTDGEAGILINSSASLISGTSDTSIGNGRIATAGDIIMHKNTDLISGNNPIYYRNLYLGDPTNRIADGSINVTFSGDVLAKDDLEINLNSNVKVQQNAGSYYGYNDTNDDGPDSSSAIVVNSDSSYLNKITIGLNKVYLAGRAFIDGLRGTSILDKNKNPMIYKTGESISVKGNYIAYQTPLIGTGDYNSDGISGDYDIGKITFSPYFMAGNKSGIDNTTNLTIKLADNFTNNPLTEETYKTFDKENKWEYFVEYGSKNPIISPTIKINDIVYIEGAGINNGAVVWQNTNSANSAFRNNKASNFEQFTKYFGYVPEDTSKRKSSVEDWINFGTQNKIVKGDNNFFVYISSNTSSTKVLSWGTSPATGSNVISIPASGELTGIVIHKGDLIIRPGSGTNDKNIPFRGTIIVTGNLIIEDDVKIIGDANQMTNIIVQNYLGADYITDSNAGGSSFTELYEGDLLNAFVNDGSGSYFSAIKITDSDTNVIDINALVGIRDWKKQSTGRL